MVFEDFWKLLDMFGNFRIFSKSGVPGMWPWGRGPWSWGLGSTGTSQGLPGPAGTARVPKAPLGPKNFKNIIENLKNIFENLQNIFKIPKVSSKSIKIAKIPRILAHSKNQTDF